jgi:thymidine kinase
MGTMFAGKSTELLRRTKRFEIIGKKVLKIKFAADNRYGKDFMIKTHGGKTTNAVPLKALEDLGNDWMSYDVIGIDEG